MPPRHLIIGCGTAGLNAIRTIREEDGGASEITLVSPERPYSRMVLPYYLGTSIAESHVYTATPASLAAWKVKTMLGRRAQSLDTEARKLTLDDARAVIAAVQPGTRVVMVGAGFISFTILNAILSRGALLTIVEVAPRILPRMVDGACAQIVARWLEKHGVTLRVGATLTKIEEWKGRRKLSFKKGDPIFADAVIMATGIKTNLEWLEGSGIEVSAEPGGGVLVDDHLRSSVKNVYAAGDVARGPNLLTGTLEVHAIEPTAQEHGRVVGANMAGRDLAYRGSLIMNIVEVCHLDVASFGQWDDPKAEVYTALRPGQSQYRKLLFQRGRLTGAMICGPANDIWTTNDVGMLKGLVYSGADLSFWKAHLKQNPFDIKPAFMATRTTAALLPQTVLGRPSRSPELPQTVVVK